MSQRLAPGADEFDGLASPGSLAWAIAGVAAGTALALVVLPEVAPAVAASLSAPQPKSWWYLSRASGLVSYALLAISMLLGLLLSTRFAKAWPGNAAAFALHEHASILGLAFALLHALVLLGDRHTPFTLPEDLLPFGAAYRPFALGIGQLALYGMAVLVATFYVRGLLGQRAWRLIHVASFAVFALALLHGLASGTDRAQMLMGVVLAVPVLFFAIYRGLARALGEVPRGVHSLQPVAVVGKPNATPTPVSESTPGHASADPKGVIVRPMAQQDVAPVIELQRRAFPGMPTWTLEQLARHPRSSSTGTTTRTARSGT